MKKIFAFLSIFLSFSIFSQKVVMERPDEVIEPNPFIEEYFKDHYDYTKFKEMISLNLAKAKDFKADTIYRTIFNKQGQVLTKTRYRGNVPKTITKYSYLSDGNLKSWNYGDGKSNIKASYFYNNENQIRQILQYHLRNRKSGLDSSLQGNSKFIYENSRLQKISSIQTKADTYHYEKDRLIRKTGGYISKLFSYYPNGNLREITEFMGSEIDRSKLMGIKKYYYNRENLLVCDSILTSSNFETKTYQVTHYEYDENQKLKKFRVDFGSSYSEVEFSYENKRLKTSQVKTNDVNYKVAYLRFPIPSGIPLNPSGLMNYKDEFFYDNNGNKTGKKVFVEGALFFEMKFELIPW